MRMIEEMAALRITEAELARDIASVPRAAAPRRRKLSEMVASLSRNSEATLDAGFAAVVQAFVDSHHEPLAARGRSSSFRRGAKPLEKRRAQRRYNPFLKLG